MALIDHLSVQGLRNLADLSVGRLGRVNLVTGKNNAGKSTLLEAIRILAGGGSTKVLLEILSSRDELSGLDQDSSIIEDTFLLKNLFTGFPSTDSQDIAFSVTIQGAQSALARSIRVSATEYERVQLDNGGLMYRPYLPDLLNLGQPETVFGFEIVVDNRTRFLPASRFTRRVPRVELDSPVFPCVYLDPFSSRSTSQMGTWWDAVALTDVEPEILRALQIVSPDIKGVSMVGGERGRDRTAIAKSELFNAPVPLRTFGDGANRLFGIILSLCNAKNGLLLIDEIENGLHYSAQTEVWHTIFRLAKELNVQVFATTHSWDCVAAFQQAATESPEEGLLLRLSRTKSGVVATSFSERELQIATRDQIEVR